MIKKDNFCTVFYHNGAYFQFNLLIDDGNFRDETKTLPASHRDKQCPFILTYNIER